MSKTQATEQQIRSVKAPSVTSTWHPFPHALLLDELQQKAKELQLTPTSTRYELSETGSQMFGVWTFGQGPAPQVSLGFRNSINKTISVGLTASTFVVVCSNMMFTGEWLQFRKHTKNVLNDLHYFVDEAFGICLHKAHLTVEWQQRLDSFTISVDQWKTLTYDVLAQGVIAPSKAEPLFITPINPILGDWFNIITNLLSSRSLLHTSDAYAALNGIVGQFVPQDKYDHRLSLL